MVVLATCLLVRRRGWFGEEAWGEEAEQKLGLSEAQLRTIFEGIGVALVDARGRLVKSNPTFEEMLGYTGE